MATRFQDAVEELVAEIEAKEREISEVKKTVNFLRSRDGLGPLYETTDPTIKGRALTVRPDQFYGKSPITAAREYLELRGEAVLPDEIADALEKGGFDFKAQGWNAKEHRARNLAISMSKNSLIFHRLPNAWYGLVKFYPELKKQPKKFNVAPSAVAEPDEIADEELQEEGGAD
ncbi:MAG TPA: hypothetical protein VIE43_25950 [Thermoanaerobaculia bacterium]|jgi:hypothetical protein|nr:hypothetical protein [Thermoanaerobaculia bacterium]